MLYKESQGGKGQSSLSLSIPRNLRKPQFSFPCYRLCVYKKEVRDDGWGAVTPDISCRYCFWAWFLFLFAFTNIWRDTHWISLDISKAATVILSGSVSQCLTASRKYWVHLERQSMHWSNCQGINSINLSAQPGNAVVMMLIMLVNTDGTLPRYRELLEAFYVFGYYDHLHFTNEETKAWRD